VPGGPPDTRIDGAGASHELLDWVTARDLAYLVGFGLPDHTPEGPHAQIADLEDRAPDRLPAQPVVERP